MNSFFTQVSSSIRILGWNRDASARATHLKAAGGNVPSATIERKSMSTKTSIKRIALVAAAALTIGGFPAVAAHAAASTLTQVAGTGDNGAGGIAGPANTLKVLVTHATSSAEFISITGGTILSATNSNTVATNGLSVLLSASNATDTLTIATPTAGSLVVSAYDEVTAGSGTFGSTATTTKTITISAAGVSGVYSAANSSVYIVAGIAPTGVALTADPTTPIVADSSKTTVDSTVAAATVQVGYFDGNGTAMKAATDSVTATITSGPGIIGGNVDSTTTAAAASTNTYSVTLGTNTTTHGIYTFYIGGNKQVGTTVVTFKNAAGTILGTKSITFAGTTVASIKVAVKKANVLNSSTVTTKQVFAVNTYDSAGNEITSPLGNTIVVTAATGSTTGGAVICSDYNATAGVYYCSATAQSTAATTSDASETYTFTVGTVTATASVKFVSGALTTLTVAAPASADPGSKVTYTLTALGANGSPLPDGDYSPGALLTNANPVTNASLTAYAFGKDETITLAAGVATDFTYAPFSGTLSSAWTVAGTSLTAQSVVAASVGSAGAATTFFTLGGIAKTLTASALTAEDVAVTANTEATAAANAATDAANQAADAADNATQAAAEALAAVNTLATTVATLIAGIKSQIASLNKLIVAIKNKLKA